MKKLILCVCLGLSLFLASCAGRPTAGSLVLEDDVYLLDDIVFNLNSRCQPDGFLNKDSLSEKFMHQLKTRFCNSYRCTDDKENPNTVILSAIVDYKRGFMGEPITCSSAYEGATFSYAFTLKRNSAVFYTREFTGPFGVNSGFLGNLGRIASKLTLQSGVEEELSDVDVMASGFADEIIKDFRK